MGVFLLVLAVILALVGLCVLGVGCAAWMGKLPGNSYVGIRVPEVRASRERWNAVHRVAGPLWCVSGLAIIISSLPLGVGAPYAWILTVVALLLGLVFLLVGANMGARTAVIIAHNEAVRQNAEASDAEAAPEIPVDMDALRRATQHPNPRGVSGV